MSGAVNGYANFDGSGNITINTTQANISKLTTTLTTPDAGSDIMNASTTIAYPTGFNKDNSIIISLMSHNTVETSGGYATVGASGRSTEAVRGNHGLQAQLRSNGILIEVYKVNQNEQPKQIIVQIVLMKI